MKESDAEIKSLIDQFNRDLHKEDSKSETIFYGIMNILNTVAKDVSEEGCKTYATCKTYCDGITPSDDVTRRKISTYYQESAWTYQNDHTIENPKFYIYQNEKIIEFANANTNKNSNDLYINFDALLRISKAYRQLGDFRTANEFAMKALKIQLDVSTMTEYDEPWMILDSDVLGNIIYNFVDLINLHITQRNFNAALSTLNEVVSLGLELPDEFFLRYGFPSPLFEPSLNHPKHINNIDYICNRLNDIFNQYPSLTRSFKDILGIYVAILSVFCTSEQIGEKLHLQDVKRGEHILCTMNVIFNSAETGLDLELKNAIRLFLNTLQRAAKAVISQAEIVQVMNPSLFDYFVVPDNCKHFATQVENVNKRLLSLQDTAYVTVLNLARNQTAALQFFQQPQKLVDANNNPIDDRKDGESATKRQKADEDTIKSSIFGSLNDSG